MTDTFAERVQSLVTHVDPDGLVFDDGSSLTLIPKYDATRANCPDGVPRPMRLHGSRIGAEYGTEPTPAREYLMPDTNTPIWKRLVWPFVAVVVVSVLATIFLL
jgi:hypothetical protein